MYNKFNWSNFDLEFLLNPTNNADFVTAHALLDRDSIHVYEAELARFAGDPRVNGIQGVYFQA